MSDSTTPETDANCWKDGMNEWVASNLARKLEQERDEAKRRCLRWLEEWHLTDKVRCDMKSERDEARGAWYEMQSSFERSRTEVEKLIRERDEARKALANEMKWHHQTHAELIQAQCKLLDMEMKCDQLQDEIKRLKAILDLIKKDAS